jgi:hypothetical protein
MFRKLLLGALCALLPTVALAAAPYNVVGPSVYTTDTTPLTPNNYYVQRLDPQAQTLINALNPLPTFGITLGKHDKLDVAITNATTAYTTGNVVGGVLYLGGMSRQNMGAVTLQNVTLDVAKTDASTYTLYVFTHYPYWSTFNDKAAPSINSADWDYVADVVPLTGGLSGLGTHTVFINRTLNDVLIPAENKSLYGVLVVTGTPTYANTQSLQLTLGFTQD